MHITQHDIANLDDTGVKALVLAIHDQTQGPPSPLSAFWRSFAAALVRALAERRRLWLVAELEVINGDDEGALVECGDDPVGDALAALRGERQ